MTKKLYKSRHDVKIDGVCAGLSDYFGLDVTLIRLLVAVLTFLSGVFPGIALYFICVILMPREPATSHTVEETAQ